jgi:hypothetical protein
MPAVLHLESRIIHYRTLKMIKNKWKRDIKENKGGNVMVR